MNSHLLQSAERKRSRNRRYQQSIGGAKNTLGDKGYAGRTIQKDKVVVLGQGLEQTGKLLPRFGSASKRQFHLAVRKVGWKQVETSLAAMKARIEQRGARLVILVIPRRDQVAAEVPATAYNTRIAELAARLAIPLLDPLAALREAHAARGDEMFIPWDGHNTRRANAVIARELAPHVRGLKRPAAVADGG